MPLILCVSYPFLLWEPVNGRAWQHQGSWLFAVWRVYFLMFGFFIYSCFKTMEYNQSQYNDSPQSEPSPSELKHYPSVVGTKTREPGNSVSVWSKFRLVECGCVPGSVPHCCHFSYCLGHCHRLWKKADCWAATATGWLWLTWMLAGNMNTSERWNKGSWRRR